MCQSVSLLISLLKLDKYRDITNLDEISFWNFLETFLGCWYTISKLFQISCMSVSLLVCYFLTEIRQIWGYLHFWMIYLSEIFLRHSLDIGSLVFTWLDWAYILTFEFLCAGLNFETSDLVTSWFPGVSFWDLWSCLFKLW